MESIGEEARSPRAPYAPHLPALSSHSLFLSLFFQAAHRSAEESRRAFPRLRQGFCQLPSPGEIKCCEWVWR